MLSRFSRSIHYLGLLWAALAVAACGGEAKTISPDPHFSFNVVRTPDWFPDPEQTLFPIQQEVIDERGVPDFFRFWWRDNGDLIGSADLANETPGSLARKFNTIRKSWIYVDRNEEVIFSKDNQSYVTRELTDPIKLITSYGDPSSRSRPVMRNGKWVETWTWIEHGLQVELTEDVETKRSYPFKGTGSGTYLLK